MNGMALQPSLQAVDQLSKLTLKHDWPAVHKNNNFKGSIYMVFDYAENDLTGLMDTNKFRFTEAQVGRPA
jgi:hypothetical protein